MSSPLHLAITQHDLGRLRLLLSQGGDPNTPNEQGWLPLHAAIGELGIGGTIDFVTLLIRSGADVNAWDAQREVNPILLASNPFDPEAVRVLIEAGADPNVRGSEGETPLRLSVEAGALETVSLLLHSGAKETINQWGGLNGLTVLGIAARRFDLPMIDLLLKEGADPQQLDEYDETARDKLPPRETCDPELWDRVIELLGRRRLQ